jgi:hypothetical protein
MELRLEMTMEVVIVIVTVVVVSARVSGRDVVSDELVQVRGGLSETDDALYLSGRFWISGISGDGPGRVLRFVSDTESNVCVIQDEAVEENTRQPTESEDNTLHVNVASMQFCIYIPAPII